MILLRICAVIFLVMALTPFSALAQITARPIPADDFARLPNISSVSMSLEGDTIAAIVASPGSNNEQTALATWNLNDLSAGPVITPSGQMQFIAAQALKAGRVQVVARQEWTGPGCDETRTRTFIQRLYLTDNRHARFEQAFTSRMRTVGISDATERCFEISGTAGLAAMLPLNPDTVIVRRVNDITQRGGYFRYNLRTDDVQVAYRDSDRSNVAFLNPRTGDVMVRERVEPVSGGYEILVDITSGAGGFTNHPSLTRRLEDRYTLDFVGFDEASGEYYVITDKFSDKAAVYMYNPATQSFSSEPALAHPNYDIVGIRLGQRVSNFNRLLGFVFAGPHYETYWIDPDIRGVQEALQQALPGQNINLIDFTDNMGTVLISASSGSHPPSYYVLRDRSQLMLLGQSRPWLENATMREPQFVTYQARDGLTIPAILTLPQGWTRESGPLPTIILPHGGPWSRDSTDWDDSGWPQFLASRGYAVLQPQYRGSLGFGRQLWLAGDAEWGQKMQDDKDDGAAWLVSQGVAAPDRIAIFGYSYGGFAAIAATVRPSSPYQCAIAGAGVASLARLGTTWSQNRLQRIYQGRTVRGMDPMQRTREANIPILLFHGDRDTRVPLFHSRDFYNAVRGNVPAELIVIPDMPHSMPWYPNHVRTSLEAIDRYLRRDCGPDGL